MALSLVTGPAIEPVSLAEAKSQCRIDPSVTDEDGAVSDYIRAAREWCENFTHRPFISQTWDEKRDAFPCDVWETAVAPVLSITSVTYIATDGSSTTWSSNLYLTDIPAGPKAGPARITPIYGGVFPQTRSQMNAVTVRVVGGYGTTAASVPWSIKAAIKLLVAHWYAKREPVAIGNIVTDVPNSVESLLWPYKHFV